MTPDVTPIIKLVAAAGVISCLIIVAQIYFRRWAKRKIAERKRRE